MTRRANRYGAMIMAIEGLSGEEIVKRELGTGVPILYRLNADSTIAEKEVLSLKGHRHGCGQCRMHEFWRIVPFEEKEAQCGRTGTGSEWKQPAPPKAVAQRLARCHFRTHRSESRHQFRRHFIRHEPFQRFFDRVFHDSTPLRF